MNPVYLLMSYILPIIEYIVKKGFEAVPMVYLIRINETRCN